MAKMVKLNSGVLMPIIGLGTHQLIGDVLKTSLRAAIAAGYRSIDTAESYNNEQDIGDELKVLFAENKSLNRSDLFITSKLRPSSQGSGPARDACLLSIEKLQCEYLDLYLIHWPGVAKLDPSDAKNSQLRKESWLELEKLQKEGKVKHIGVSNYTVKHLEDLFTYCTIKPAVNQCEHHPYFDQTELAKFCAQHGIHFQAYSSLGRKDNFELLNDLVVVDVAKGIGRSVTQVLLRWAIQGGIGVLPSSRSADHIQQNFDLFSFELDDAAMKSLNNIEINKKYCWDPEFVA